MRILTQICPVGRGLGPGCKRGRIALAFDLLNCLFVNVPSRTVVKYPLITIFALFVSLFGLTVKSRAADLVVSNNSTWCWFSDSTCIDDDSGKVGNIAGFGAVDYIYSYLALNYPQFNISFYNLSRSGGLMNDEIINTACAGVPAWGYQFNHNQHIGIAHATENGSLNSNAMYQAMSTLLQADGVPRTMSSGLPWVLCLKRMLLVMAERLSCEMERQPTLRRHLDSGASIYGGICRNRGRMILLTMVE
jgi:hypothetical protein